jgi:hypothetical protein
MMDSTFDVGDLIFIFVINSTFSLEPEEERVTTKE